MATPLNSTVLFDLPQQAIKSLIVDRIGNSTETSIVTGFATPGGIAAISTPIRARPQILRTLVVGAATYPGFEALDGLLMAGVPADRLFVHLGHTADTGGKKNPFARYHPMLHSKVYYTELPNSKACAFIGSHNLTTFAIAGLNGEAAVMLEGSADSPEFEKVRAHINAAQNQAVAYSPAMKEAYAWWMREFIDGLKTEIKLPQDWQTTRTILLIASAAKGDQPKTGDQLYFEIPAGIEQIESLKTETHLFLFDTLPSDPWQALTGAVPANAKYTCTTLGAENKQGNLEVEAHWRISETPGPVLMSVPRSSFRPNTPSGKQQVRAEVKAPDIVPYEYLFERARTEWEPEFSGDDALLLPGGDDALIPLGENKGLLPVRDIEDKVELEEARVGYRSISRWKLVKALVSREGSPRSRDEVALRLASPDSGKFILVSLRRRRKDRIRHQEREH
jgi:hypothetical protein